MGDVISIRSIRTSFGLQSGALLSTGVNEDATAAHFDISSDPRRTRQTVGLDLTKRFSNRSFGYSLEDTPGWQSIAESWPTT